MSVALRTITRLQDADDINVTLGAGVDEYALCWDNDTAKFVLRAMSGGGVTDHGALTGLADDDHSQYLLATGARTGASSQAQTFTSGIIGPSWKPASDGATALQMQAAAGTPAIITINTVNNAVGLGTTAPAANGGWGAGTRQTVLHLHDSTTNLPNLRFTSTGADFTFGCDNTNAYMYLQNAGSIRFSTNGTLRMAVLNDGKLGLGGVNAIVSPLSLLHAELSSAATATVTNVLTIGHNSTGTAANGFGAGQAFTLATSTTADQSAARIQVLWSDATHATRKADLVLTAYDTSEREGLRIRGAGSAPAIGFLGAAPVTRIAHVADPAGGATVDAEARSAINSILTTLESFGFHATS